MDGHQRRNKIMALLLNNSNPTPARLLGEKFNVSRQVIVGDIALLRAEGNAITATNRGYIIKEENNGHLQKTIVMDHSKDQTRLELETFVNHNIIVESVTIEHPLYGEFTGQLNIETKEDIDKFLNKKTELLSSLTEGIHIHTIRCPSEDSFEAVKKELRQLNMLYVD